MKIVFGRRYIPYFVTSVPTVYSLLNNGISNISEIAFVGYSNSGKSSVINTLANLKKLTKVSSIPGSTRSINLFKIGPELRLLDFPGYGYYKRCMENKIDWHYAICQYLKHRDNLKGLILIMDIRHAIKSLDQEIINQALTLNIPILALLNKSDKLSKNNRKIKFQLIQKKLKNIFSNTLKYVYIEIFSSVKKCYEIESVKKILNFMINL